MKLCVFDIQVKNARQKSESLRSLIDRRRHTTHVAVSHPRERSQKYRPGAENHNGLRVS